VETFGIYIYLSTENVNKSLKKNNLIFVHIQQGKYIFRKETATILIKPFIKQHEMATFIVIQTDTKHVIVIVSIIIYKPTQSNDSNWFLLNQERAYYIKGLKSV